MADEQPRFRRYGNCLHVKTSGVLNRVPNCYNYSSKHYWADDWSNAGIGDVPELSSLTMENVAFDGFITMKPSLTPSFSLANFILELGDLKELFSLWKKHSGLIQNIAGGYLNYQFGWKLFIQDCKTILDSLHNWRGTLLDYKSKQNIPMTRHYTVRFKDSNTRSSFKKSWANCRVVVQREQTATATMRFTYRVPMLDRSYSDLLGLLDMFGLNNIASVVWEAIPFSFVVDWFLRVGDYLSMYGGTDWLESVVTIEDFCVSIHTIDSTDSYAGYFTQEPILCWSKTTDTYERRRMLPRSDKLFGDVMSHRYGTKQILLSAALLLA
jgi:hypothetical protein